MPPDVSRAIRLVAQLTPPGFRRRAHMSTVSTGQTYTVASGQTDMTGIVLSNGLDVITGGTLGNTIVSGGAIIGSGIDTTINNGGDNGGGFEDVVSKASASGTSIEGGTVEVE